MQHSTGSPQSPGGVVDSTSSTGKGRIRVIGRAVGRRCGSRLTVGPTSALCVTTGTQCPCGFLPRVLLAQAGLASGCGLRRSDSESESGSIQWEGPRHLHNSRNGRSNGAIYASTCVRGTHVSPGSVGTTTVVQNNSNCQCFRVSLIRKLTT